MDTNALLCNICPKQPSFSDVSHLLTHVSSKAHLSHYFKLQVRSHQEPQAGQLLHEYNRWYRANDLARLLSDRMASKEARQKKRQGKAAAQGGTYPARRNFEPKPLPGPRPTTTTTSTSSSTFSSLPGFLDPRLSRPYPKVDPLADEIIQQPSPFSPRYVTPAIPSAATIADDNDHDGRKSCLPTGPVSPLGLELSPERSMSGPWKRDYDSDSGDDSGSVLRATPRWHGSRSGPNARDEIDPRLLPSQLSSDPFIDSFDVPCGGHETDRERADEIARLKGVLWPGMDVFDSATEQMRRKRNQKKDENVLKKMEKTSRCVEATELIFSPSGILRKRRVINGNVDDSSPLKGETPIPKRRPVRPKRLLFSQKDPNIGPRREPERKRAKKASSSHNVNRSKEDPIRRGLRAIRESTSQLPVYFRGGGGAGGYDSSSLGDGDDDFNLTIKSFDQRPPRSGFTVFQDDQDQCDLSAKGHYQEDKPHFEPSGSSLPSFPRRETVACGPFQPSSFMAGSSNYVPNFTGRHPSCHPSGKENIEPSVLSSQGPRTDPVDNFRPPPPFNKTIYNSDATAYPPHYFFGDVPHTTFGPLDGNELSGYSLNPLAISLPRLPVQEKENHIYNTGISPSYDRQPATRPASPDGTISDVEQDDFERLYLDGSSY